jgi:3',5'-nucleoside bisphosphate phosphatase
MKKISLIALGCLLVVSSNAQFRKQPFTFPDADGYKVLKGDFHQHTVFSDGLVWPTTRVEEAYEEDLDVICLTDHIEYRPHLNDMTSKDHNRSYELAKDAAERYGILLLHSAEVTRAMPPGHLNVIDIQDGNPLEKFVNPNLTRDTAKVVETLEEARRQGGFIFWNHTAYPTTDNKSTWHPIHEVLKNKGLMMGIEVVNGERYEPTAFGWCLKYNLTIFANTDVHSTMAQKRSADEFKVMTLVLAKDRSKTSVMEALRAHRTVALWNNRLIGRAEHVEPIVRASIVFRLRNIKGDQGLFEIDNKSGLPFTFEFLNLPEDLGVRDDVPVSVHAYGVSGMKAYVGKVIPSIVRVRVLNTSISPDKCLETSIPLIIEK